MGDDIPKDFGWRYVLWNTWLGLFGVGRFFWSNAITILMIVQGAFASVLLIADSPTGDHDPTPLIAHTTVRLIIVANSILCAVIAQFKRGRVDNGGGNSAAPETKQGTK